METKLTRCEAEKTHEKPTPHHVQKAYHGLKAAVAADVETVKRFKAQVKAGTPVSEDQLDALKIHDALAEADETEQKLKGVETATVTPAGSPAQVVTAEGEPVPAPHPTETVNLPSSR